MAYKRWYDKHAELSQAVNAFLIFPDDVQSIIAEGALILAKREFSALEKENQFKSLGTEKVLALYKSKQKKRQYDANHAVHSAINHLSVLSLPEQLFMANQIITLADTVVEYMEFCKSLHRNATLSDIQSITDTHVEKGPKESKKFLMELKKTIIEKIESRHVPQSQLIKVNLEKMILQNNGD